MLRVQRDDPPSTHPHPPSPALYWGMLRMLAHDPENGILVVLLQRNNAKSDIRVDVLRLSKPGLASCKLTAKRQGKGQEENI